MASSKLYMLLVGCRPKGRHTEQHDTFFGIGNSPADLIPALHQFWPEAKGNLHVDAWREITNVNGFKIEVVPKDNSPTVAAGIQLFFINLGGYKPGEFDEFHYKLLIAAADKSTAIKESKKTAFYQHTGFKGAASHVDDKYGIDVDDLHEIKDILPASIRNKYQLNITASYNEKEDELHLGYFKLDKL